VVILSGAFSARHTDSKSAMIRHIPFADLAKPNWNLLRRLLLTTHTSSIKWRQPVGNRLLNLPDRRECGVRVARLSPQLLEVRNPKRLPARGACHLQPALVYADGDGCAAIAGNLKRLDRHSPLPDAEDRGRIWPSSGFANAG
jgi:hypothetical protein